MLVEFQEWLSEDMFDKHNVELFYNITLFDAEECKEVINSALEIFFNVCSFWVME